MELKEICTRLEVVIRYRKWLQRKEGRLNEFISNEIDYLTVQNPTTRNRLKAHHRFIREISFFRTKKYMEYAWNTHTVVRYSIKRLKK